MSAGLFFVRARHERQRVAAAGRTRIAAIVAIAGECVCGNPTCANRCLGPASGENGKCPATKIRQSKGRTMRAAARTRSAQRRAARRAMRHRANAG
ncbi:hypothetical protein BOC60_29630 [Burkholderia pseudomallei]|nr:hypothetical protein BK015_19350 [Burkholderia pseudomallei]ARK44291.1 hypothetical protein BOC60_29630 [Burkholderia pseudomallei]